MREVPNGIFVTFEGGEGSGKSTQILLAKKYLEAAGFLVTAIREPGGTPLAEAERALLLDHRLVWDPVEELLALYIARNSLVRQVIRPALEAGAIVLCDRYFDSSLAYQIYGRNRPDLLPLLAELMKMIVGSLVPDLTFVFDLPVAAAAERLKARGALTRIDAETADFHERVGQGFRRIVGQNRERCVLIDGGRKIEAIEVEILEYIRTRLQQERGVIV